MWMWADLRVSHHHKPYVGAVLAQQGEPIDRNRALAVTARKFAPQKCEHWPLAIG